MHKKSLFILSILCPVLWECITQKKQSNGTMQIKFNKFGVNTKRHKPNIPKKENARKSISAQTVHIFHTYRSSPLCTQLFRKIWWLCHFRAELSIAQILAFSQFCDLERGVKFIQTSITPQTLVVYIITLSLKEINCCASKYKPMSKGFFIQ